MEKTIENSVEFSKHVSSKVLKGHKHIYLLGSGLAEIATKEGALKIKELTYTHCQALNLGSNIANSFYSYMAAKLDTPILLTILESGNLESDLKVMEIIENKLFMGAPRNAVVITDIKDVSILNIFTKFTQNPLNVHKIPKSGFLSALLSVIPLQRIAYDLTIEMGYDPDRPRNLAKELTTK